MKILKDHVCSSDLFPPLGVAIYGLSVVDQLAVPAEAALGELNMVLYAKWEEVRTELAIARTRRSRKDKWFLKGKMSALVELSNSIDRERIKRAAGGNVCVSDGPADAPELTRSAEGPFAARNGSTT